MVLNRFNGWMQIVQLLVFRQIRLITNISQPYQKNFEKPRMYIFKLKFHIYKEKMELNQ